MRLEGIAKGGFYPTPEIVVRQIAKHLDPSGYGYEPQEVKVLDPCCGDGVAAAGIGEDAGRADSQREGQRLEVQDLGNRAPRRSRG